MLKAVERMPQDDLARFAYVVNQMACRYNGICRDQVIDIEIKKEKMADVEEEKERLEETSKRIAEELEVTTKEKDEL